MKGFQNGLLSRMLGESIRSAAQPQEAPPPQPRHLGVGEVLHHELDHSPHCRQPDSPLLAAGPHPLRPGVRWDRNDAPPDAQRLNAIRRGRDHRPERAHCGSSIAVPGPDGSTLAGPRTRISGSTRRHPGMGYPTAPHPDGDGLGSQPVGIPSSYRLHGADEGGGAFELLERQQTQRVPHEHRHPATSATASLPARAETSQEGREGDQSEVGLASAVGTLCACRYT